MNEQANMVIGAVATAVITYFTTRYLQDKFPSENERLNRRLLKKDLKARKNLLVTYHVPE